MRLLGRKNVTKVKKGDRVYIGDFNTVIINISPECENCTNEERGVICTNSAKL